jgi:hypothetical protein
VQGPPGGAPLLWFENGGITPVMVARWETAYQAYTTPAASIAPGEVITASAPYPIDPGQALYVGYPTGVGAVSTGTLPQAIEIFNQTSTSFYCGISQEQGDDGFQPICAFPLQADFADVIVPVEQVFLMFSTQLVDTGTVIERSLVPGVLVDLTGNSQATVSFDIDEGWMPGPGATPFPADTNLVALLISSADAPVAAAR